MLKGNLIDSQFFFSLALLPSEVRREGCWCGCKCKARDMRQKWAVQNVVETTHSFCIHSWDQNVFIIFLVIHTLSNCFVYLFKDVN